MRWEAEHCSDPATVQCCGRRGREGAGVEVAGIRPGSCPVRVGDVVGCLTPLCLFLAAGRWSVSQVLVALPFWRRPSFTRALLWAREAFGVLEKALLGAAEVQAEVGDGCIGDRLEGGAQAGVDGVDLADEVDVADLAVEVGDEVGEPVRADAEVDGAFERFFEQRGVGLGVAEDGAGRASAGANCSACRCLDVGVVEDLAGGQGDRSRRGCFPGAGGVVECCREDGCRGD